MKYWRNETSVKGNINCEKYTINNKLYDKAEFKKKKKKITAHLDEEGGVRWPYTKFFIFH